MSSSFEHPLTSLSHRSLGITAIYNELKESKQNRVLDLGTSSAASFNFFTQLSCKIHFESLDEFLGETKTQGEDLIASLEQYMSVFEQTQKFDIVLLWDTLNYLDLPSIRWLMQRITAHCHENTLIHAMRYTSIKAPAIPCRFSVIDKHVIQIQRATEKPRRFPSYSTTELLRNMPHLSIEQTYLNYEGMQPNVAEQVIRFKQAKITTQRMRVQSESKNDDIESSKSGYEVHHSPGFEMLIEWAQKNEKPKILDLGIKSKRNSDYFSQFTKNVYCEDIYSVFHRRRRIPSATGNNPIQLDDDIKFDAIFAWDICSFLEPSELLALFASLKQHCNENTRLHIMLHANKEHAVSPCEFRIKDKNTLYYIMPAKREKKHSLNTSTLLKASQFLVAEKTFILQPGMHKGISETVFKGKSQ